MATALLNKTFLPEPQSVRRQWHIVDAKDYVLGRLASRIASILVGKHKTVYAHSVDYGDFVIVVNAEKIKLTGQKLEQKYHFYHTHHPGGARIKPYKKMMTERPERILFLAVKRML